MDSTTTSPKLIQDRTLSAAVTHVALCPNMNLVAVTLDANSLAIFRTSWHRLATIAVTTSSPDERISTIAWSPTGAHLIAATSHRRLLIYSVDRVVSAAPAGRARRGARETETVATFTLPSPPTSVIWTASASASSSVSAAVTSSHTGLSGDGRYEDRASLLLPIVSNSQTAQQDASCVAEKGFVFVGDSDGFLTILTSDLSFTVARVSVIPTSSPAKISRLHVTSNAKRCVVIATHPSDIITSKNEINENETQSNYRGVMIRVVDLTLLREFRHEIERVAQEVVAWNTFLITASTDIDQVETAWSQSVCEMLTESIVRPLRQVMEQYAEDGSHVWHELHDIFCGARIKGSLLHFLANNLGENGAKELLRSFEVHDTDAARSFAHLLPLAENALARASELRSLASVHTRFDPVGVTVGDTDVLFEAMSKFYEQLYLVSEDVVERSNEPAFFLVWIVLAARRAGGEVDAARPQTEQQLGSWETENILKFFERMTKRQTVSSLLRVEEDEEDDDSDDVIDKVGEGELEEEDIIGMDKIAVADNEVDDEQRVKDAYEIRLNGHVQKVRDAFETVAKKPCLAVSAKVGVVCGIELERWGGSKCRVLDWDGGKGVVGLICGDAKQAGSVTIVKHKFCTRKSGSGRWSMCRVAVDGGRIHDAVLMMMKETWRMGIVVEDANKEEEYMVEMVNVAELGAWLKDGAIEIEKGGDGKAEMAVVKTESDVKMRKVRRATDGHVLSATLKQKVTTGFHMNGNEETDVVSVLAMPKRVLLFLVNNE